MRYIKVIVVQLFLLSFFLSCKMYSSGRTNLESGENFTIINDDDSKSKVRVQNFSNLKLSVFYDNDTLFILPEKSQTFKLKKGKKMMIMNNEDVAQKVQVRYFTILNNTASITRAVD